MQPLEIGRKYTFAELEAYRDSPQFTTLALQGYVWRQDLDGTLELIHYSQATRGGGRFEKQTEHFAGRGFATEDADPFDKASLPKITRRTPQERMASLMSKVGPDILAGRVMTLQQINDARPGRAKATELTGEVVREAVQSSIEKAEAVNEEAEAKKVVRTSPTD